MDQNKKTPHAVECTPGNYAWCTCGLSDNFPHCNGAHKTTDKVPHIHIVGSDTTVYICSCGKTENPPFCNGNHDK